MVLTFVEPDGIITFAPERKGSRISIKQNSKEEVREGRQKHSEEKE
jgi:hypothetical protein